MYLCSKTKRSYLLLNNFDLFGKIISIIIYNVNRYKKILKTSPIQIKLTDRSESILLYQ